MINSNQKGSRGEREAAKLMTEITGNEWRRTQQYCGHVAGDPDIISESDNWLHIEVKRNESFTLNSKGLKDAMEQAINDASKTGRFPVVLWRVKGGKWAITWMIQAVMVSSADIKSVYHFLHGN